MAVHKHKKTGRFIAQRWDTDLCRNVQVGTFATKEEAWAAITRHRTQRDLSAVTVSQWRERWLSTPGWRSSTRSHRRERTRSFDRAHGADLLVSVDRRIARRWIAQHPADQPYLSAMFGAAAYEDNEAGDRLVADNPFSKLTRRRVAKRDIQADWLGEDDVAMLEDAARRLHNPELGDTVACMIRFAAETGVRPGELFVLEEADLDVANGVLHVRRSFESKTATLGSPKNGKQREVVLSQKAAVIALAAIGYGKGEITPTPRLTPYDEPVRGDEFWLPRDTARIFSTSTGAQWRQPSLATHWSPVRRAAGRPDMRFYDLRHYCATRLLDAGLRDDEVAVQLGHTDGGKLVRDVYGHPNNRRALDRVREALDGADAA